METFEKFSASQLTLLAVYGELKGVRGQILTANRIFVRAIQGKIARRLQNRPEPCEGRFQNKGDFSGIAQTGIRLADYYMPPQASTLSHAKKSKGSLYHRDTSISLSQQKLSI